MSYVVGAITYFAIAIPCAGWLGHRLQARHEARAARAHLKRQHDL